MAGQRFTAKYRDLRGGLNTGFGETLLSPNELRRVLDGRVIDGRACKRNGSRRIHDTSLIAAPNGIKKIQGGVQWQPSGGLPRQVVVITEDTLRYIRPIDADFVNFGGFGGTTSDPARFATARIGGNLLLFIAAGVLKTWSGSAVAFVTAAPANAIDCCLYKGRMYVAARDSHTLYGSRISPNVNDFTLATGGLQVDVETYDNEAIVGLLVCGHSLIIAKEESLTRLSGVSTADIKIEKESEGISREVGVLARGTFIPVLDHFFFVSEHGPFLGSESGVESLNMKLHGVLDNFDREMWRDAVAVHNIGRHEIVLCVPTPGTTSDANPPRFMWAYDYLNKKWDGPWQRSFLGSISALWKYERPSGKKAYMSGNRLGWVLDEDIPHWYRDDTLRLGADGQPYGMTVQYPATNKDDGTRMLSCREFTQHIEANLHALGELTYRWSSELGTATTVIPSAGPGLTDYPFKTDAQGLRITQQLSESTEQYAEIGVLTITAEDEGENLSRPTPSIAGTPLLAGMPSMMKTTGNPALSLAVGESRQLVPIAFDGAQTEAPLSGLAWTSTDATKVAVTQTGIIRWLAAGTATITATGPNSLTATWSVTAL